MFCLFEFPVSWRENEPWNLKSSWAVSAGVIEEMLQSIISLWCKYSLLYTIPQISNCEYKIKWLQKYKESDKCYLYSHKKKIKKETFFIIFFLVTLKSTFTNCNRTNVHVRVSFSYDCQYSAKELYNYWTRKELVKEQGVPQSDVLSTNQIH